MRIRRPRLKMFRTPTFRYIFIHGLIFISFFGGVAFLANWSASVAHLYWVLTLPIILIGALHTWLVYAAHENWPNLNDGWGVKEGVFTCSINLLGAMVLYFMIAKKGGVISEYAGQAAWCSWIFMLPFFWHRAFYAHLAIPEEEYPPLIIETLEDIRGNYIIEPNEKGIIWKFENVATKESTFRMWMPSGGTKLTLAQLFKIFLLEKENEGALFSLKENEIPVKWRLYHTPKGAFTKKIINPSKTIIKNKIQFKKYKGRNKKLRIDMKVIEIFVYRIIEHFPEELPKKEKNAINTPT